MPKTGAFELSMSFIIVVIFAVVLLSLALVWIQSTVTSLEDLSGDMFRNAREKVRGMFTTGEENFYIWPEGYDLQLSKDTRIGVLAAIKNDADDGEDHEFVVNAYATRVPQGAKKADVDKWLEFPDTPKAVKIGGEMEREIKITIPRDAKKGSYYFEIAACWDESKSTPKTGSCNGNSDNLWGDAAQDFVLTIK